jgi:hypothetical protein
MFNLILFLYLISLKEACIVVTLSIYRTYSCLHITTHHDIVVHVETFTNNEIILQIRIL